MRMANSVDPDEMACNIPSHLYLHCLLRFVVLLYQTERIKDKTKLISPSKSIPSAIISSTSLPNSPGNSISSTMSVAISR